MNEPTKPNLLPVIKASLEAGVHPSTVDRKIALGLLPIEWHAGRRLVDINVLRELISQPPARSRRP